MSPLQPAWSRLERLVPPKAEAKSWHRSNSRLPFVPTREAAKRRSSTITGGRPFARSETRYGYHFTGTPEHRVRVIDETGAYVWRHLRDLQTGDWVALQKNTYPDSTDYRFAPSDRIPHFNAKQIKTPDRPTAELGEFIGYLIGDGCINYYNRAVILVAHPDGRRCRARSSGPPAPSGK